ncbi:unnamed protein product [Lathyrus oleraceus]
MKNSLDRSSDANI